MTARRTHARRPAAPATDTTAGGVALVADFAREQAAMAMDASCAMFRGFEAMRGIQQEAAKQAFARHQAAARELRANSAPADVMGITFGVLQADLISANGYWQSLAAAALETQSRMMSSTWQQFDAQAALEGASAADTLGGMPSFANFFPMLTRDLV